MRPQPWGHGPRLFLFRVLRVLHRLEHDGDGFAAPPAVDELRQCFGHLLFQTSGVRRFRLLRIPELSDVDRRDDLWTEGSTIGIGTTKQEVGRAALISGTNAHTPDELFEGREPWRIAEFLSRRSLQHVGADRNLTNLARLRLRRWGAHDLRFGHRGLLSKL